MATKEALSLFLTSLDAKDYYAILRVARDADPEVALSWVSSGLDDKSLGSFCSSAGFCVEAVA